MSFHRSGVVFCALLCFSIAPPTLAAHHTNQLYLNVCRDTPLGSFAPGADITEAIQWAIDNQRKQSFKPYIPAGVWRYSQTLRIPNREGGWLAGVGRGETTRQASAYKPRCATRAIPTSRAWSTRATTGESRTSGFAGRMIQEFRANSERPSVGILSTTIKNKKHPHYQYTGTTQLHLRNVALYGWTTGFQNGETLNTHNSDLHTLTDCVFADCQTGFWNKHSMGMELSFTRLKVHHTVKHALRFDAGGTVYVHDANTGGGGVDRRFLVTSGRVGEASGGFYIDGFKLDGTMTGKNGFQLIEMLKPAATDFVVEKYRVSNEHFAKNGGLTATLYGDSTLTLRDSYRPGGIVCKSFEYSRGRRVMRPHILIDNCRLPDGKIDIKGEHSVVMRDCLDWNRWPESFSPNPRIVPERR